MAAFTRDESDPFFITKNGKTKTYYHGLAGDYGRASAELAWQRKLVGPLGQVFTPFASVRGDVFALDPTGTVPASLTSDPNPTRFMPTAGFEWSWPILMTAGTSTHVIEPIAQVIARPDEPLAGKLTNDDAQSLVFDNSTLFQRDKFSGYDRVEGGTRVNAAIRYLGTFSNGLMLEALFGQSFAVAGKNSFAEPDLADVGAFSGLESANSDYVGRASIANSNGARLTLRGRFDQKDFTLARGEVEAAKTSGSFTAAVAYIYAREIPQAGFETPTSQITGTASMTFVENWRVFGSAVVDLDQNNVSKESLGLAFDNSCLSLSIAYTQTRKTDIPTQQLMFNLSLRTLAEGSVTTDISSIGTGN